VRPARLLLLLLAGFTVGCGSGSARTISVGAARTYGIEDFELSGAAAGRPAQLSFKIGQPSGEAMTAFRKGGGPHTGVHVILVRKDLGAIIHRHPPPRDDGTLADTVTFPSGGRYRMVVDVYPARGPRNFQLFKWITVPGKPPAAPPANNGTTVNVDGDRFVLQSKPRLRAIEAAFLKFAVTGRDGKPARFTPYYGALAHAIFFRKGTLDYFHTHVCGAGATGCTSQLGASSVTGTSTAPGVLRVGVLLPVPGTWRLFLQTRVDGGRVVTAPFTLAVR
jgi:hypothetical protein